MNKQALFIGTLLALGAIVSNACGPAAPPEGTSPIEPIKAFPDPVSYDLKFDIDYKTGLVTGDCVFTVRNAGEQAVPVIPLNLYRLMEVSSVTDDKDAALEFSQNVRIFEDWKEFQVNHIRVRVDPPLGPGRELTLRIRYAGLLLGYSEAMRYVKDHVSNDLTLIRTDSLAYPQIGVPSWRTNRALGLKDYTYTVSLAVPSGLVVANPGELISQNEQNGRTTWIYKSRVPSWRIDLAIANYERLQGPDGRLRVFFFPEDSDGADVLLDRLTKTMDLYAGWFGPLKVFPGLTVIEIPDGYGSQADVAAVIQEASAFKDASGLYTFYHELSHLWNVESKDPLPPRFESEGLAMFLQHLVQERLENKTDAVKTAVGESIGRLAKLFGEHPDWKETPMISYGEKDLTDLSYRMGQIFFYLLYENLGESAFMETMGGFYQDDFETGATARQFADYVKSHSKVNLDTLFEDWVFTAGAADLLVSGITLDELIARYR